MATDPVQRSTIQRMLDREEHRKTATSVSNRITAFAPVAMGGSVPWQRSEPGPLPTSINHHHLPTLTIGRDALPARCAYCGSKRLALDDRANDGLDGRLVCARPTCERQLAWVRQGASMQRTHTKTLLEPALPPGALDFERVKGCTAQCDDLHGHHPLVHESYGIALAKKALTRDKLDHMTSNQIVRTGYLTIDTALDIVYLDGVRLDLTINSLTLLVYLAKNIGAVCDHQSLSVIVSGRSDIPEKSQSGRIRNWVQRLRIKLGPQAARLIRSVEGHGYQLALEAPLGETGGQ